MACASAALAFCRLAREAMRLACAFSESATACWRVPRNSAGSISAITSPRCTCELKSALSVEMVPETCEPTCTVVTAFTEPVASTTSRISPRSTAAVTYSVRGLRFTRPTTTRASAMTSAPIPSHRRGILVVGMPGALSYSARSASMGSSSEALRAG